MCNEGIANWIRNTSVLSKDDDREVAEIRKLKRVDANKISKAVSEKLNAKDRLTDRIRIYLFRKYSDKTLKEIGTEFGNIGVSGVSHVVMRLGK